MKLYIILIGAVLFLNPLICSAFPDGPEEIPEEPFVEKPVHELCWPFIKGARHVKINLPHDGRPLLFVIKDGSAQLLDGLLFVPREGIKFLYNTPYLAIADEVARPAFYYITDKATLLETGLTNVAGIQNIRAQGNRFILELEEREIAVRCEGGSAQVMNP